MDLAPLGFDRWFEECGAGLLEPGHTVARVTAVDRDAFLVRDQDGETFAELAGRLRFSIQSAFDLPCVGDWVCVRRHTSPSPTIIETVFPRRTSLRRKSAGRAVDFQMIAANIDVAFLVQSCHYDFNLRRLDRYLVMARDGHIEPRIVLSKIDLIPPEELERQIAQIGQAGIATEVLALSNTTGAGVDEFRKTLLPGRTHCLLGSSGVGKTTLINRIIGRDTFNTRAVSATGEGVHTTARRHLLVLDGGALLIDTPGMRELGLVAADDGVSEAFAELHDLSQHCRFPNCTHTQEPGCAILQALRSGEVTEDRYRNYLKLKKESDYHTMSYVDKRKKDRAFGRFIKSAKKWGKAQE